MKCMGRTTKGKRCSRNARILFCRQHRLQPFAWLLSVLTIIGLFAGIYQDLVKPVKESISVEPSELAAQEEQQTSQTQALPQTLLPASFVYSTPDGIYSLASATSRDLGTAYDKAILIGKGQMANYISDLIQDGEQSPEWHIMPHPRSYEVMKHTQLDKQDGKWRAAVLLKLPR